MPKSNVFFMEVSDLKSMLSIKTIDILVDKETRKKSFKVQDNWFRVQNDINLSETIAFMTSETNEDGTPNWLEGCLVNVDKSKSKKDVLASI